MAEPFLWGSRISLPAELATYDTPHVTALANGTFLVVGKVDVAQSRMMKAWIYNADGSLKEEREIDVPGYGLWSQTGSLESALIRPVAVELPDGRIGIMATLDNRSSGFYAAFAFLYSADLTPIGSSKILDGIYPNGTQSNGWFMSDAILSLGNGDFAVTYHKDPNYGASMQGAFIRIVKADGTLSDPVTLGPAEALHAGGSITSMTLLSNGKAVILVRENGSTIKGMLLDTSGSGSPTVSPLFTNANVGPNASQPEHMAVEVTALEGGRFVVSWTQLNRADYGEPQNTVFYQIYNDEGGAVTPPTMVHGDGREIVGADSKQIVALPEGGFAIATRVAPDVGGGDARLEIRLSFFDADGLRMGKDLLVDGPSATSQSALKELSVLADGRLIVQYAKGLQIVDPRSQAVLLKGTNGADQYVGTAFDDTFGGSAGADKLNGGGGIDVVSFASAKAGVTASLAGGTGGDAAGDVYVSVEALLGSSFDDVFTGNGSAILKGGRGDETYTIRTGDVVAEAANEGRDTAIVGDTYALTADAQIEVLKLSGLASGKGASLTGSEIANAIFGHAGRNTLKGQGGNDTLHGGAGHDALHGGAGKDAFVFDTRPNKRANVDKVLDFSSRNDGFHLDDAIFTKLGKGSSKGVKFKSDMFVEGTQAKDAQDRIVYDRKTGALYYDQDGTGSKAQVKIATLANKAKIYWHDFFVI